MDRDGVGALCGVLGPSAFVGAWLVAGARTDGYDLREQAISELAQEGASTRVLMTAGFVAFGLLMPWWAATLGRRLAAPAVRVSATVAGLATLAVALFPLTREGDTTQDLLHGVSAGIGYVAMALTPLLAAGPLRRRGLRGAAVVSVLVGAVSAVALVGSVVVDGGGGLQRVGLTVVDLWHVAFATVLLLSPRWSRAPLR